MSDYDYPEHEVYASCVAHCCRVRWLPAPTWWQHTSDLSTCVRLLEAPSPLFGWIPPWGRGR